MLGGAVGGVARQELAQIVANLVADQEHEVELWIRPERVGDGYTVEWTTLEYDPDEQDWQTRRDAGHESGNESMARSALGQVAWQMLNRITAIVTERMPTFEVDRERINVFAVDDRYLFKHYFDQDEVFGELRGYYNESDYRFEIPEEAFADVQETLEDHFYDPVVVDDPDRFCVVHRKYADHPDVLFKASVLQQSKGEYHVFLMKDQLSVEQAVSSGAERLVDSDIEPGGGP